MKTNFVLIHGFATGVRFSFFRDRRGSDAGFSAFRSLIATGEAKAFRWNEVIDASFWQTINPWFAWHVYRMERKKSEAKSTLEALHVFLERERPETIVCHSLGCRLWLAYVRQFGWPEYVRTVAFVQADLPTKFLTEMPASFSLPNDAQWFNFHCFWDPSLFASSIANFAVRAGQKAVDDPRITNVFFPLVKLPNLHMSSIRDSRLYASLSLI